MNDRDSRRMLRRQPHLTPLELVYGFGPRDVTLGKSFFVMCKYEIFPMDYHVIRINKTKASR